VTPTAIAAATSQATIWNALFLAKKFEAELI